MRSPELQRLNFEKVLHYPGGQPVPAYHYPTPVTCTGYCVSCERGGLLQPGMSFTLMSHGADTSDFEQACHTPIPAEPGTTPRYDPVMFVLETPGGDWEAGDSIPYEGYQKRPPVRHYYWMPKTSGWPQSAQQIKDNYGGYFAYLIRHFQLHNAYVTNLVKCGLRMGGRGCYNVGQYPQKSRENCMTLHFAEELKLFKPRVVFAFGVRVHYFLRNFVARNDAIRREVSGLANIWKLLHPRPRRHAFTRVVDVNNDLIYRALLAAAINGRG